MQTYEPLSIDLVDEGRLLEKANESLTELQEHLADHRKEYGDASKGASVKLVIEIELGIELPKTGDCFIKSKIKKTLPAPPPTVTRAAFDLTDKDAGCLFVRHSGSNSDHPNQQQMDFKDKVTS